MKKNKQASKPWGPWCGGGGVLATSGDIWGPSNSNGACCGNSGITMGPCLTWTLGPCLNSSPLHGPYPTHLGLCHRSPPPPLCVFFLKLKTKTRLTKMSTLPDKGPTAKWNASTGHNAVPKRSLICYQLCIDGGWE
jgi:hypothetical protein